MTPQEVLKKSAEILRTSGWCQGEYENQDGAHCLMGAMRAATGVDRLCLREYEHNNFYAARDFLDWYVYQKLNYCGIVNFNDTDGRTVEEVLALLDEAANRQ